MLFLEFVNGGSSLAFTFEYSFFFFFCNAYSSITLSRYEAVELRDGDKGKYLGKGVSKAVKNINDKISEALIGMDPTLQSKIDQAMIDLDKTENKVILVQPLFFLFFFSNAVFGILPALNLMCNNSDSAIVLVILMAFLERMQITGYALA